MRPLEHATATAAEAATTLTLLLRGALPGDEVERGNLRHLREGRRRCDANVPPIGRDNRIRAEVGAFRQGGDNGPIADGSTAEEWIIRSSTAATRQRAAAGEVQ